MNKETDCNLFCNFHGNISKFAICLGLLIITPSLYSESYSEHRLDDDLYRRGGGRQITVKSRAHNLQSGSVEYSKIQSDQNTQSLPDNKFSYIWNIYSTPRYLSRKGGRSEDLQSGYQSQLQIDPEFAFLAKTGLFKFYTVISPSISYEEEQIVRKQRETLRDGEIIIGLETSYFQDSMNSFLQGGRGFQRLDRYGFIMADRMNFIEFGNRFNLGFGTIGLSLIGGNYNKSQMNLSPRVWNEDRYNIHGGSFILENWWNLFSIQLFYYNQFQDKNPQDFGTSLMPGEKSGYSGFDFIIKNFYEGFSFGGGLIQFDIEKDFYMDYIYIENPKISHSSRLYFGKLEWTNRDWYMDLGFFLRTNECYKPMKGSIQMLGGSSSALIGIHDFYSLGQFATNDQSNSSFRNGEVSTNNNHNANLATRNLDLNRFQNFGINSGAMQVAGLHISKSWVWLGENWDTGIYLNSSNSYLGRGLEGILRFGWSGQIREDKNSFAFVSVAQARITGAKEVSEFVEGLDEKRLQSDFIQFYISCGIKL
ncbi:hypothetical protein [Leptospira sp. GIMC2001]|uniref:hypothetical protein n=1 Tax=Leptospira sp. GIMC2001 TaxID=1513297 RepID=UPI00234B6F31|nr:hypothetical protein [Leptospira sp. GIMC2001]WCL48780.1 hypothetical protein O4O04_15940 [Leptospira sp. GIMC2001]